MLIIPSEVHDNQFVESSQVSPLKLLQFPEVKPLFTFCLSPHLLTHTHTHKISHHERACTLHLCSVYFLDLSLKH